MKTKQIAKQYGSDKEEFENFIDQSGIEWQYGSGGMIIDDELNIDTLLNNYKLYKSVLVAEKERQTKEQVEERARITKVADDKIKILANMLITSGFNFDGYTITKYSGYISGDDAVQIDRGTSGFFSRATNVGDSLMASLVQIRRKALAELKEAAYALGCNAVIGVDFDYLTLDPQTANTSGGTVYLPYVFGVTANGNAVIIEKTKL